MPFSRRDLLRASLAASAGGLLPWSLPLRAAAPTGRKFIFVVIFGGWDVTRVFAPEFDNGAVSMEDDAALATVGGLSFVDHPSRPGVRALLERCRERLLVINGLVVPSVSHTACMRLAMTGNNVATAGDWPVLLASDRADHHSLPHVVVRGPQYPGSMGGLVTRIGTSGSVEALLRGEILEWDDQSPVTIEASSLSAMDQLVQTLADRGADGATFERQRALLESYATSLSRGASAEALVDDVSWSADESLTAQADLAVDLLRLGASRCVTIASEDISWDSHQDNDLKQSGLFEMLFTGLDHLMTAGEAARGDAGGSLADETVVVVMSEMGRTPGLNDAFGKDHWSHTSAMLIGPGITGDRVLGGFDELFYGQPVDPATGEVDEAGGVQISPRVFGATLMALAGMDPAEHLPNEEVLTGALA